MGNNLNTNLANISNQQGKEGMMHTERLYYKGNVARPLTLEA
jgi:hypothetical protein